MHYCHVVSLRHVVGVPQVQGNIASFVSRVHVAFCFATTGCLLSTLQSSYTWNPAENLQRIQILGTYGIFTVLTNITIVLVYESMQYPSCEQILSSNRYDGSCYWVNLVKLSHTTVDTIGHTPPRLSIRLDTPPRRVPTSTFLRPLFPLI